LPFLPLPATDPRPPKLLTDPSRDALTTREATAEFGEWAPAFAGGGKLVWRSGCSAFGVASEGLRRLESGAPVAREGRFFGRVRCGSGGEVARLGGEDMVGMGCLVRTG